MFGTIPNTQFNGLIVGYNGGTITNSYYLPQTSTATYLAATGIGGGTNSGVTEKTSTQLQGLASTLGSTYWTSSSTINDGYPYLKNNKP